MASFNIGKKHFKIEGKKVALYVVMIILVVFSSAPLVYMVSSAFKPLDELFLFPPRFFVQNPTLDNFKELLTAMDSSTVPFTRYFFNSVIVTGLTVVGTVIVCSMAAYALTKMNMPYANVIFNIIVATLMFSPPVTQITNYILINKLGWINTYWALIIPKLAGSTYFFLLKQNFDSIVPNQILEAGKIDGANEWQNFIQVAMPVMKPATSTVVVFSFVASWNDYFGPLVYINKQAMKTLPLALQLLQGGLGQVARQGAFAAATLITTAPTIIIFMIMQSRVINTMAYAGIK